MSIDRFGFSSRFRRGAIVTIAVVVAIAGFNANAIAQNFPSKPVTVAMPLLPSHAYALAARQMADSIQARTGRTFVLDPAPGASGSIAVLKVKRAEPDGHAIGLTFASALTLAPLLTKEQQYDPLKDFSYITMLNRFGILYVGGKDFPPNNLREMIALAKAKPDTVKYSWVSLGTRLGMLQIEDEAGVKFFDVRYKLGAQGDQAALSGEVDFTAGSLDTFVGLIKAGKMKPLFIGSRMRSPVMPDVPSVSELYPNVEIDTWYGLYAPAGTAADRIDWLRREWTTALREPKMAEQMQKIFAYEVVGSSPQVLSDQVRRELATNSRIVQKYNLTE